jgi:hypothetical protein
VYLLSRFKGRATKSPEMGEPERFPIDKLPYERMLLADRIWVPCIMRGEKIVAKFWYGPGYKTLVGKKFQMRAATETELARL